MYRFYSNPTDTNRVSIVGQYAGGVLKLAAARCSSRDHFVRKIGRAIAEERLGAGKCISMPLKEQPSTREFNQIAEGITKIVQSNSIIINKLLID